MPVNNTRSRISALVLTMLVFVGALSLARRNQPVQTSSAMPESVVWSAFDASRAGDVKAYLDCFTGDLERNLRKTMENMSEPQFADYLKRTNEEIKGVAVSDLNRIGEDELSLKVEFVYKDKNEVQEHYLKRVGGSWKIRDVKGTERVRTLIPYGTEVTLENK